MIPANKLSKWRWLRLLISRFFFMKIQHKFLNSVPNECVSLHRKRPDGINSRPKMRMWTQPQINFTLIFPHCLSRYIQRRKTQPQPLSSICPNAPVEWTAWKRDSDSICIIPQKWNHPMVSTHRWPNQNCSILQPFFSVGLPLRRTFSEWLKNMALTAPILFIKPEEGEGGLLYITVALLHHRTLPFSLFLFFLRFVPRALQMQASSQLKINKTTPFTPPPLPPAGLDPVNTRCIGEKVQFVSFETPDY